MRLASSSGRLVCALLALVELSFGAGCEAMNELPARKPADVAVQGNSAQSGSAGASKNAGQAGSTGSAHQPSERATSGGRAAPSGAGASALPYIGDVPARAASSGVRPCGSSEFSAGPCGGRHSPAPVAGSAGAPTKSAGSAGTGGARSQPDSSDCQVIALPDSVRGSYQLDAFYKKYANAAGIPVLASDAPADRTLQLACLLVKEMTSERQDVHAALLDSKVTFAILGRAELTTDIPEYRDLPDYYDTRSRGLGGHTGLCAEENITCDRAHDPYRGQSVCVHEFAHTIAIYGLFAADSSFEDRLAAAFGRAKEAGLWRDTWADEDAQEYWAEGVQGWYDTNLEADPADGVHGPVNTIAELEQHDRVLYNLIDELLPTETAWPDCYRQRP